MGSLEEIEEAIGRLKVPVNGSIFGHEHSCSSKFMAYLDKLEAASLI